MPILPTTTTFTVRGVALTITPSEWTAPPPSIVTGTHEQFIAFLADILNPAQFVELLATSPDVNDLRGVVGALKFARSALAKVGGRR
jgi:hypothetical protein